jgi:integrase
MGFVEHRGKQRYRARFRGPDGREGSKTFRRRIDAERFLVSVESAKLKGEWIDPAAGKVSLRDFAEEWMSTVAHLRPSTRNRYGSLLRVHILPALGYLSLAGIRPLDIQAFVSGVLDSGVSATTAHHAYRLLSEVLKAAQLDGRIGRNPAAGVSPPARRCQEQRYLTAEEVWALAEAVDVRYRALILTGVYGALRWGELAGLRVTRLRLLERRIDIVETLVEVGSSLAFGPPKTGRRTVSIPGPLVDELARHLTQHRPGEDGLVFPSPAGTPLRHANFYRREWRPALERAGLDPGLRIHDLRHTSVALAIAARAHPKEIQELCGHASIGTTLNVYGHLFEGLQDRLAERLGDTFRASRAASVLA